MQAYEDRKVSPPRTRTALPSFYHYLYRPGLHFGRRTAHAGGPGHDAQAVRLGGGGVRDRLRGVRNPERIDGRPHRAAQGADADRDLVVGVHLDDGVGVELPGAAAHPLPVRSGGGGGLPQQLGEHIALVPDGGARAGARAGVDGEPRGRGDFALPGDPNSDGVGVAGVVFLFRVPGHYLGGDLVLVVPRSSVGEARREQGRDRGDRRGPGGGAAQPAVEDRAAPRKPLVHHADVLHLLLRVVLLPLLDADVPLRRTRVHREGVAVRDAAVHAGRAGQPGRAGSPATSWCGRWG